MTLDPRTIEQLSQTGQVMTLQSLEGLVNDFEGVLKENEIPIKAGSDLEGACLTILEVLGKHQNLQRRDPMEDIRAVFTVVLGFWLFLTKIVRLRNHPNFKQFVPHLQLLNEGTIIQNTQIKVCEEATNKIFELLFALCMLDLGTDVVLDPPNGAKGDNPDILVTLDGLRWGFACKTIYGATGKSIFDNLKKGVDQIEKSPAQVGCMVLNLRNFLDPQVYWPITNLTKYKRGEQEPLFAAFEEPTESVKPRIDRIVEEKRRAVLCEIGKKPLLAIFEKKKAIPAFLGFAQTATAKKISTYMIPTSLTTLSVAYFGESREHEGLFHRISDALHEQ
jgi:hypothetical protein